MERTEHREQFFAEVHRDPYTYRVTHMWADAFVQGQEVATKAFVAQLKAAGEERAAMDTWDHWHAKSWSERRTEALEFLTDRARKSEAELLAALAAQGPLSMLPPDWNR